MLGASETACRVYADLPINTCIRTRSIRIHGVLLVNLGTPEEPTAAAVRRFLKQFLSDPRVIEYPRWLWWLILNGVILRIRPSRSAEAYRKIWTDKGSPLMLFSKAVAAGIPEATRLALAGSVNVELAMSYGDPSIDAAIDRLLAKGARRLLVLPMYPQYSGTTTASVLDAVARKLNRLRWVPEMRFINQYHDEPGYIEALAASIREFWQQNGRGTLLIFSFHGVPKQTLLSGDPYHCQCQKTARLVAEALELGDDEWLLSFQSRVGREEWLRPYTDETIAGARQARARSPGRRLPRLFRGLPRNARGDRDAKRGVLYRVRRKSTALHPGPECPRRSCQLPDRPRRETPWWVAQTYSDRSGIPATCLWHWARKNDTIGQFLEFSVRYADVLESLHFYKTLGFAELDIGDVWPHKYAVVSDGELNIGLHDREFDAPALTFVQHDLAKHAPSMTDHGFNFSFMQLGEDSFNELRFADRDGHMIIMLEARTFHASEEPEKDSLCGSWFELTLPVRDALRAAKFWAPIAPTLLDMREEPTMHMRFDADGAPLGLSESIALKAPVPIVQVSRP